MPALGLAFENPSRKVKMIISVSSMKGGVGKTTISLFLAQALSKNYKVALLDFDPQASLTDLLTQRHDHEKSAYNFLSGQESPESCMVKVDNIDFMPCIVQAAVLNQEANLDNKLKKISKQLRKLDYDFILIDTPPGFTFSLRAALFSADKVLCPVSDIKLSMQGYELTKLYLEQIRQATGRKIALHALPSIVTSKDFEEISESMITTQSIVSKSAAIKNAVKYDRKLSKKAMGIFEMLAQEVAA